MLSNSPITRLLDRFRPEPEDEPENRTLVINGHPDPRPERFCAALCRAYEDGARAAGWAVRCLTVGHLPPDLERAENSALDAALADIAWASQILVVAPLLTNRLPAQLRRLFELNLLARALHDQPAAEPPVRLVITMEMPAFAHRSITRAVHDSADALFLPGFPDQRQDFIGSIASIPANDRQEWLDEMRYCGMHAL